jgi:hypothetical protein
MCNCVWVHVYCDLLLVLLVGHARQQHIPLLQTMVNLFGGVNATGILAVHVLLLSNLHGKSFQPPCESDA